ncbi:MAG: acetylglutamate kinase [Spirochaetes bacterium]|jgi:acetylglutamate kinase|nr:acetylglutamate kinase [Spirochaetota bacterium]
MRILVKLGGRAIETSEQRSLTAGEIAALRDEHELILVHGGGHRVTTLAERLGIRSTFVDGVRMTSPAEMELVDMVLAGSVNTELVRALNAAGVAGVGVTGADARLVTGSPLAAVGTESTTDGERADVRTGTPARVDPAVIEALLSAGMTPVCGSVAADETGGALNINADAFAVAVAGAVNIDICLFVSDVEGVRVEGEIKQRLTRAQVERAIADGEISGGMIPKVHAATEAVEAGARAAIIGSFDQAGELVGLVKSEHGTRIVQ